jgi:hypothetical protein
LSDEMITEGMEGADDGVEIDDEMSVPKENI